VAASELPLNSKALNFPISNDYFCTSPEADDRRVLLRAYSPLKCANKPRSA